MKVILKALLLPIFGLTTSLPSESSCTVRHYQYKVSTEQSTYAAAQVQCEKWEGTLATYDDVLEKE